MYDAQNYGMLHRYVHIPVYYLNIESSIYSCIKIKHIFFENESAFQNVVNQHSTLFLYLNIPDIAFYISLIEPITCVSYFNPFSALCLLPRFNSQSNDKVVRRIVIVWARMTVA